jgi:hypothetical protein
MPEGPEFIERLVASGTELVDKMVRRYCLYSYVGRLIEVAGAVIVVYLLLQA